MIPGLQRLRRFIQWTAGVTGVTSRSRIEVVIRRFRARFANRDPGKVANRVANAAPWAKGGALPEPSKPFNARPQLRWHFWPFLTGNAMSFPIVACHPLIVEQGVFLMRSIREAEFKA